MRNLRLREVKTKNNDNSNTDQAVALGEALEKELQLHSLFSFSKLAYELGTTAASSQMRKLRLGEAQSLLMVAQLVSTVV